MTRELQPCGTTAAYMRHLRHGEQPCAECTRAARDRSRSKRGVAPSQVNIPVNSKKGFPARLARYTELRQNGLDSWDAAMEVGVDPVTSAARYERWMEAS